MVRRVVVASRLVQVPCNLCGAEDTTTLSRDGRWGERVDTVACRRCGLVYVTPRLDADALGAFYRDRIYPQYHDPNGGFQARLLTASRTQAEATFTYFVERAGVSLRGLRLLEVGCGLGDFLVLARRAGTEVLGVELDGPYADFAERQHGLPVVRSTIEAATLRGRFDVIAMFHVLEHVEDPRAALTSLHRHLAPGGRLLIEVPNFMAPTRMPLSEFLRVEHLYNFSPVTLREILRASGFRQRASDTDRYLLRVVAEAGGDAAYDLDWAQLRAHHRDVLRHVLIWRLRARLFRLYYALKRRRR